MQTYEEGHSMQQVDASLAETLAVLSSQAGYCDPSDQQPAGMLEVQ